MLREQWYEIHHTGAQGLNAATDIDGIRVQNASAWSGDVIPGRWFDDTPDDRLEIILQGRQMAAPYQPQDKEYPLLYTIYPGMIPDGATFNSASDGPAHYKNKWYQVHIFEINSLIGGAYNGLAALVTVPGICKAGQVAAPGDIVPVQWFSALDSQQFRCLTVDRMVLSQTKHSTQDMLIKRNFAKARLVSVRPQPQELQELYQRFPGADPDYVAPVQKSKKRQSRIEKESE